MKKITTVLTLIITLISCQKEKNSADLNSSAICFDITLLKTNMQETFLSVFFISSKEGYVAGNKGGIYKTTDSAKTWTSLNSTVNLPIRNLFFLDDQTGFAVGGQNFCADPGCIPEDGFILKTSNAGQTWSKIYTPPVKTEFISISFVNDSTGFCVGSNLILKTSDRGLTWTEYKRVTIESPIIEVKFIDHKTGFIVCFSKIIKTDDVGETWSTIDPKSPWSYYTVSGTSSTIYLAGQGKMIKSADGGKTWSELPNSPNEIRTIRFIDEKTGFAFGAGNYSGGDFGYPYGAIYCTNNGGATWNGTGNIQEMNTINSVSFFGNNIGYAVSWNRVLRLTLK